jgi:hypothetical protein
MNLKSHKEKEMYFSVDFAIQLMFFVYLYDYMDTFDKFDETILPTHKQFYNRLSKSHISHDDNE